MAELLALTGGRHVAAITEAHGWSNETRLFGDLVLKYPAEDEPVLSGPLADDASGLTSNAFVGRDVDERLVEVFRRAANPADPLELRNLYLGQVEASLRRVERPELADMWTSSRVRRN